MNGTDDTRTAENGGERKPRKRKTGKRQSEAAPVDFKPFYTDEQVARIMDTTEGQIENARKRHQIPAECVIVIPGFGRRYKAQKLRAWLSKLADEVST